MTTVGIKIPDLSSIQMVKKCRIVQWYVFIRRVECLTFRYSNCKSIPIPNTVIKFIPAVFDVCIFGQFSKQCFENRTTVDSILLHHLQRGQLLYVDCTCML